MALVRIASRAGWVLAVVLILLIGAQFVGANRTNPPSRPEASLLAQKATPPAVRAILDRSCRDCHSNDTRWPWYSHVAPVSWFLLHHINGGRDRLNYSQWTSYDSDDQDKFLNSMCSLTRKGRMPLPSYLWIHRDARLSDAEINTLCAWSDKMRDTLQ
ncbi:MAG TPA: heme-binding domain-containing protein [Vicinamibacterales bacterium]